MSPKLVMAAVSAAASIIGGVMAARAYGQAADTERQVGATNQEMAERDAKIKEQQAEELLRVSDLDQMEDEEEFRKLEARTQLALSHNGWLTDSGSAAYIQIANADEFEQQQERNEYAARVGRDAQREGAVQDRMRGSLERQMAEARATGLEAAGKGALLGSVSKAASIGMSTKKN